MKQIVKRLIYCFTIALTMLLLFASPVLAIGDPDSISFGITSPYNKYAVYENVIEDGDMLFAALPFIEYASEPTDYTASEAFTFQVLDTVGTTVLYQIPVVGYQDTIIGIYLSAAQVTAGSLVYGSAYYLRLAPNPTLFTPSEGTNQASAQLSGDDWNTGTLGYTQTISASNSLRMQMITWALQLEDYDSPTGGYTVYVNGIQYLNTVATQIFINGISGLDQMCPPLFQVSSADINLTIPAYSYSTGTVSGTSGTKNITGVGTDWTTISADDEYMTITGDSKTYKIDTVTSATTLTLVDNLETSPSGATYTIWLNQAYSGGLTPENQLGTTIHNGIKNIGNWLNVGELGGGIVVMIGISLALIGTVWAKFHSAIAAEGMGVVVLLIGIYFGILPMPIGIIIISLLALIALILFITRGIL